MSQPVKGEEHLSHATVEQVAQAIRRARAKRGNCVLMVGAGCSASAGIPLASAFVKLIEEQFALAGQVEPPTYNAYMRRLTPLQRRRLIEPFLEKARMNAAHLCMANLVHRGFVDRILTTNFDPLVIKACALMGEFPGMYDLAASRTYKSRYVMQKAVMYLHGQRAGFNWANTDEEVARQARSLKPVFCDAARNRVWIIIGYSGDSDRLLDTLTELREYEHGLFWVPYMKVPLPSDVQRQLLSKPSTHVVRGHDADSFFVALNLALEIYPPEIVERPFSHLERFLKDLPALPAGHSRGAGVNLVKERLRWAAGAIRTFEIGRTSSDVLAAAHSFFAAGRYEYVAALRDRLNEVVDPELEKLVSHAFRYLADGYAARARMRYGEEADEEFATARHLYGEAMVLWPGNVEARRAWASACAQLAERLPDAVAGPLLAEAVDLYSDALKGGDRSYETRVALGNACSGLARLEGGARTARALWKKAEESYRAASRIHPRRTEAWFNWAVMLAVRAALHPGDAGKLLAEACTHYQRAISVDEGDAEAHKGLADALAECAHVASGVEVDRLFAAAETSYARALALRTELLEAHINLGFMLARRAAIATGDKARALADSARQEFEAAEMLRPGSARYHLAALDLLTTHT